MQKKKVGQQLENEIRDRDLDTCIRTSTEYGIARREKNLKKYSHRNTDKS